MHKKKKIKTNKQSDLEDNLFLESDENFYFIAGYTDGGIPYGITWEEAIEDGLVERKEVEQEDDLPF